MNMNTYYEEFEQKLRGAICASAVALSQSGMSFAVFAKVKCDAKFWNITSNGGFSLKAGTNPSDAINDIYENGWQYATECATAMTVIYYKALLEVYGAELFNRTFGSIYLMDWDIRDPLLSKAGFMETLPAGASPLAGDRGYFANPDHDPALPQWQGENVIVLDDGMYYGHGIGINDAKHIINSLNSRRKSGDVRTAYLMNQVGRPDFKKLADIMRSGGAVAVWREFPPASLQTKMESGHSTFV